MRRTGPDSLLKLLDGAKGLVHSLVSPLCSLPDHRHQHHSDDDGDVMCDRDNNVEDADCYCADCYCAERHLAKTSRAEAKSSLRKIGASSSSPPLPPEHHHHHHHCSGCEYYKYYFMRIKMVTLASSVL